MIRHVVTAVLALVLSSAGVAYALTYSSVPGATVCYWCAASSGDDCTSNIFGWNTCRAGSVTYMMYYSATPGSTAPKPTFAYVDGQIMRLPDTPAGLQPPAPPTTTLAPAPVVRPPTVTPTTPTLRPPRTP